MPMKSDELASDVEEGLQIRAEQLKLLFAPTIPDAIAHISAAIIMISLLWDQIPASYEIFIFFAAPILVVTIVRLLLFTAYKRKPLLLSQIDSWEKRFLAGSIAIGLVWALTETWLFSKLDAPHQFIVLLIIAGIAALGTINLSPMRSTYITFIPIVLMPITVMVYFENSQDASDKAYLLMLITIGLLSGAEGNCKSIVRNIALRIEGYKREKKILLSEEKLQISEERFALAMKGANDGLWDWNLETDEVYYSPRWKEMLGYKEGELENSIQTWRELVNSDERAMVFEKIDQYKNGINNSFEVEFRMCHKQGCLINILAKAFLVRDEASDKPVRLVGTHTDVTENKVLEAQFRQSQKMESLGTLVGGIAHDFNNMLGAIMGNTYLAQRAIQNPDKLSKYIKEIDTISDSASGMIKQLLSFSRSGEMEMKNFALKDLLKESFKFAQKAMPANIERTSNMCDMELHAYGDRSVLQQALMNLLNNARDAVAEVSDPNIDCSMRPFTATEIFKKCHPELEVEDFAKITVKDNGSGIIEGQLDKIFEPFFTTKDAGKGTGLGLAMVFGAVKAHGGAIEVESELGKGTAFHIFLPTVGASVSGSKSSLALLRGAGEFILLVDDDELLRKTTEEILLTLGYKVSVASDGVRAFDIFKDHADEIDLVLTDVVMPKMGGIDLVKSIRKTGNRTPVVFMTGYDDALSKPGDESVRETPVIRKPFSAEQLSQFIRKMIEHN